MIAPPLMLYGLPLSFSLPPCSTYMGKAVLNAVKNVNELIAPALLGMDPTKQAGFAFLSCWCCQHLFRLLVMVLCCCCGPRAQVRPVLFSTCGRSSTAR